MIEVMLRNPAHWTEPVAATLRRDGKDYFELTRKEIAQLVEAFKWPEDSAGDWRRILIHEPASWTPGYYGPDYSFVILRSA